MKKIFLCLLLVSCSSVDKTEQTTIIPPRVVQTEASFVGNEQNSGVLGYDQEGFIMHESAIERYKFLANKFNENPVGISGNHLNKEGMVLFLNLVDRDLNK